MGRSWRSMLGGRDQEQDDHNTIDVPISAFLTGEKAIPGVPSSVRSRVFPTVNEPVNSEGEVIGSPLLTYFFDGLRKDNVLVLSPYFVHCFPSIPREMMHAIYYPLYLDETGAMWNFRMEYIERMLGPLVDSVTMLRSTSEGAEEVFATLAPLFFMDVRELRNALGFTGLTQGTLLTEAMAASEKLRHLQQRLEALVRDMVGHNEEDESIHYASIRMVEDLYDCAMTGVLPGARVESFLSEMLGASLGTNLSFLDIRVVEYCPGGFFHGYDRSTALPGRSSDISRFLDSFNMDELPRVHALLNSMARDNSVVDDSVTRWMWLNMDKLTREKMLELGTLVQEYNLEWALAAIDMDDNAGVNAEREFETVAP